MPLTYDEILQSLTMYNEHSSYNAASNDSISRNIIENHKHLKLKQPPLPDSFERPGDFFKFVLCEVGTPGKAPAMKKPHPKTSSRLNPTALQCSDKQNGGCDTETIEDRKRLILKRAEELYNKKKQNSANRIFINAMEDCNKLKSHKSGTRSKKRNAKRVKKSKLGKHKSSAKPRKRSKSKPNRKRRAKPKLGGDGACFTGIVGNKKKKKKKKKIKSKQNVKKKSKQKFQPTIKEIKYTLKRYDSSNDEAITTNKKLLSKQYDATAIELHDLNDTQVNKLLMTSVSKQNDDSNNNKFDSEEENSLLIYTNEEVNSNELTQHLQKDILFSNHKGYNIIKQKSDETQTDKNLYSKKEMGQFSTPPILNEMHATNSNNSSTNNMMDTPNTSSSGYMLHQHLQAERAGINKSDTLYLSHAIANSADVALDTNHKSKVYKKVADTDDLINAPDVFNVSTIVVPDVVKENKSITMKGKINKTVPEWILAKENIVRENRKRNKAKGTKLAQAYSRKKKEIISKSILNMNNNNVFNSREIVTFGYPSMVKSSTTPYVDSSAHPMHATKANTIASPMYTPWKKQDKGTILDRMNKLKRKQRKGRFIR